MPTLTTTASTKNNAQNFSALEAFVETKNHKTLEKISLMLPHWDISGL